MESSNIVFELMTRDFSEVEIKNLIIGQKLKGSLPPFTNLSELIITICRYQPISKSLHRFIIENCSYLIKDLEHWLESNARDELNKDRLLKNFKKKQVPMIIDNKLCCFGYVFSHYNSFRVLDLRIDPINVIRDTLVEIKKGSIEPTSNRYTFLIPENNIIFIDRSKVVIRNDKDVEVSKLKYVWRWIS